MLYIIFRNHNGQSVPMISIHQMAAFIPKARFSDLSDETCIQVKIRILESLGVAVGAVEGVPIRMIRFHIQDFDHSGRCTMLGEGTTALDFATLYDSALVRYLDYKDNYPARGETCHPIEYFGAVLAAVHYAVACD
jgi:2-methylcitrate dehydratase